MDPNKQYLCLNILSFKKDGITSKEFRDYMINVHAPHVGGLLAKHGITHWSMSHADDTTSLLFDRIRNNLFANLAPFDAIITLVMPEIETWQRFQADEFFKTSVGPDHTRFADPRRSQMMLGWYRPLIMDGRLVIETGLNGAAMPAPGEVREVAAERGEGREGVWGNRKIGEKEKPKFEVESAVKVVKLGGRLTWVSRLRRIFS